MQYLFTLRTAGLFYCRIYKLVQSERPICKSRMFDVYLYLNIDRTEMRFPMNAAASVRCLSEGR